MKTLRNKFRFIHANTPSLKMTTVALATVSLIFVVYVFFVPKFLIGEIFFGRVPFLYNLTLAKFFYKGSIYYDTKNGLPVPFVHHELSRVYFIEGNLEKSLDELKKELAIYPAHYQTYYIQGLTLGYMQREKEAIEAFSEYIKGNPSTWAARNDKAWLQFRIGDMEGALKTIEPAYTAQPKNPWVLNTYGILLMNNGNLFRAKEILEEAQLQVNALNESTWGRAYPGNDPRVYGIGLSSMKKSIDQNLLLVIEKISDVDRNTKNK